MTVGELVDKLKEYPQDMPVAICFDPYDEIEIGVKTWIDTNYPYDKPSFEYVYIE